MSCSAQVMAVKTEEAAFRRVNRDLFLCVTPVSFRRGLVFPCRRPNRTGVNRLHTLNSKNSQYLFLC
jgi:hypothetical protein